MELSTLLSVFRKAIADERDAQEHYRKAIKISEGNAELQRVFSSILREEEAHERRLVELYQELKATTEE